MNSKFSFELSVLLLILALFVCFPARAEREAPELSLSVQKIVYSAQQAIAKKDYEKAEKILKDFLGKHPEKSHYLLEFTLGNAFSFSGKEREALSHYVAAAGLYPDCAPCWQNMGKIYFDLKRYEKAGDCLLKVYELDEKKDTSNLYYAAVSYLMAKKEKKALPHLEDLVSGKFGSPKTEWLEALLNIYMNLGLMEKAFKVIHRLLQEDENNPSYWKILAHLHLQKNDYKKGAATLTIYSHLTRLKQEETVLLGDLNQAIGLPLKAAEYYERAFNPQDKSSDYEKLASAYLAGHRPKKAREVLERALKKNPTSSLWFMLGQVLYEEEKFKEAYGAFKKSGCLNARDGRPRLMMGYCALQMNKRNMAKKAFQRAARFPKQRKTAKEMLKQIAACNCSATDSHR